MATAAAGTLQGPAVGRPSAAAPALGQDGRVWLLSCETECAPLHPLAANLQRTAERVGWRVRFVAPPTEAPAPFTVRDKMRAYAAAVAAVPDTDWVLCADSRDVLALRGPACFLDAVRRTAKGKPLLVSMETRCGGGYDAPDTARFRGNGVSLAPYWSATGVTQRPFRQFANSGLVVGTAAAVREWLAWGLAPHPELRPSGAVLPGGYFNGEQLALGNYINTFPDRVALDTQAEVLHTSGWAAHAGLGHALQCSDAPNDADYAGSGRFFLHLPSTYKHQREAYARAVTLLLDMGGGMWHPTAWRAAAGAPPEDGTWRQTFALVRPPDSAPTAPLKPLLP